MLNAKMAFRAMKTRFVDHSPFILSHLITTRCNANCVTCLWKEPPDARTNELGTEEVAALYRDAGKAGFAALVLWGGEPLLRHDAGELLAVARASGMKNTVITNGWELEAQADSIGPHTDRLMVSVDTIGSTHDQSRGLPGLFERLDAGVQKIRRDHTNVFIIINVVLSRLNLGRLREIADYGRENGHLISFQALNESEYGLVERPIDGDSLRLTLQEEQDIAEQLVAMRREGYPLGISDAYLRLLRTGDWSYSCHFKKICLRVEPNGDVLDCTLQASPLANVRNQSIAELARSPLYQDFTRRAESCRRCRDFGTVELSHLWEGRRGSIWNALKILS